MAESKEEEDGFFSYSSDMWALGVVEMVRNMELYHSFPGGAAPRWSCFMVELRGSATPELFFRAGALPKHALYMVSKGFRCTLLTQHS
jgi:hypothetical protein